MTTSRVHDRFKNWNLKITHLTHLDLETCNLMVDQHSKLCVTLTDWDTGVYYPPWFLIIEKYSIFFATNYWILLEQLFKSHG